MRTDYPAEQRVNGNGVFLEREEIVVTVMLETGGDEEDGDAEEGAQSGSVGDSDIFEGWFIGEEGSYSNVS